MTSLSINFAGIKAPNLFRQTIFRCHSTMNWQEVYCIHHPTSLMPYLMHKRIDFHLNKYQMQQMVRFNYNKPVSHYF